MLRPHSRWPKSFGESHRYCVMCVPKAVRYSLGFDSGSVEPEADETLTGADSEATGVVDEVQLESGTWAGGDAAGQVHLKNVTGASDYLAFTDNEAINGSVAGDNCLTAAGQAYYKGYGVPYPESQLVEYNGKWYCREHFKYRFRREWIDEEEIDKSEDS